jgi:hypothetical protein
MIPGVVGRGAAGKRRKDGRGPIMALARILTLCGLSLGVACGASSLVRAADTAEGPAANAPYGGVACSIGQPFWVPSRETAETLPWPSVYLGHFSGGRPYQVPDGRTLVDWRNEYVCFPTSGQCRAWVRESYKTHHRPEGYRACLLLR